MFGEDSNAPRKRKSRWGDEQKKSRWGNKKENPASAMDALNNLSPEQKELYAVRLKLAQVSQRLMALEQNPEVDPTPVEERSPSPEPTYDKDGMRSNLRPVRTRAKLMKERTSLLEQAVALNPGLASAIALAKKSRKIPILQGSSAENNFIGLIIGPRGNTQKRLEKETGTKISIRGKGAHKNNKHAPSGPQPGDDEELHVLVVGDTDEIVDAAAKHLEELLNPASALNADHKMKQLRELASMNGTALIGITCRACGAEGHKLYDCPKREKTWKPADVHCSLCGSGTHPDKDCTRVVSTMKDVTSDYMKFISELSGRPEDDEIAAAKTAVQRAIATGETVVSTPARPSPAYVTGAPEVEECAPGEEGMANPTPRAFHPPPVSFFPTFDYSWVAPC